MPRLASRQRDIDVILIGEVRPIDVEDVDLGGRLRRWIRFAFVVGPEWPLVGMRARVRVGDARNDRVGEHQRAVAAEQIASIETLTDQKRVVVRPIVVGAVDLEEASVEAGQHERRASHPGVP